ncbi:MAG: transporter [Gammaproteobacteria bacterium]|nr:transporter [Gammaproteobacteria bacterium]
MSVCFLGGAVLLNAAPVGAQTGQVSQTDLQDLKALIELQRQQIETQQRAVERQQKQIETQRGLMQAQQQRLDALEATTSNLETITLSLYDSVSQPSYYQGPATGSARYGAGSEGYAGGIQPALYRVAPELGRLMAQDRGYAQAQPAQAQAPVGEAPAEEQKGRPPAVPILVERGGVLTPQGTLVIEPSVKYSHSSINRFVFGGIEVADIILVGQIEASDADRDSLVAAGTLRYGVTDRIEVEVKVPYVYRSDRVTSLILPADPDESVTRSATGSNLGDVEFAAHYQLNRGRGGWPFFVANLRVKSDTGDGPFDVPRDAQGVETELPTGSGFWAVQPSVTAILPTDPAVLFASLAYIWSIERDIDKTISTEFGDQFIGTVDPGDSIGASFGMSLALNERTSFSLGYKHNYILETTTEIGGFDVKTQELQVGALLFGLSYGLSDTARLNVNLEVGATEDAPDVQLTFRVPVSLVLF